VVCILAYGVESDVFCIVCSVTCICIYVHMWCRKRFVFYCMYDLYSIAYICICAYVLLKVIRILLHGAESDVHCCIVCSLACIYIYVHMWWRK